LRGRLVPPGVPLYRSRAQQFDDLVLEAVARLEPRWEAELSDVEFAVQEVPDGDTADEDGVPLARIVRGSPDISDPGNPATGPRIVLFRQPLLARAEDDDDLSELVFDVVVEEFAEILGVEPEIIDPGYGELGLGSPLRVYRVVGVAYRGQADRGQRAGGRDDGDDGALILRFHPGRVQRTGPG
jgi:predicted Zn-dependent protease with MMP-like domain